MPAASSVELQQQHVQHMQFPCIRHASATALGAGAALTQQSHFNLAPGLAAGA